MVLIVVVAVFVIYPRLGREVATPVEPHAFTEPHQAAVPEVIAPDGTLPPVPDDGTLEPAADDEATRRRDLQGA